MAEDPKVSGRYRELPREEPPRALDDAILTASRRAVSGRRRWYVPLAAAAVITLSVAVTLHIQHDRPSEDIDAVSPAMKVQETPAPKAAEPARVERRTPQPFAAAPPAAEAEQRNDVAAASAGARASRDERPRGQTQMARASVERSPESELERIARLRAAGRHEDADRALAEFRKRHPDYRIAPAMLERVEKK
jgi:hypothetical protein